MSFYMTLDDEETYVDMGYMDDSALLGGSQESSGFVWIPIPDYVDILFWFARTTALRFGEEGDSDTVEYSFDNSRTND